MIKFFKILPIIYFIAVFSIIIFLLTGNFIGFNLTKPLLAPILILYIFSRFKNLEHPLIPILLVAIFFSYLGDILFMVTYEPMFFKVFAICAFTIAQGSYGMLYYLSVKYKKSVPIGFKQRWPEFICLLILMTAILYLHPTLGDFKTPILIYAIVSSITVILAINRRFYVSKNSFWSVLLGVFFFFLSDFLTGIDFEMTEPYIHAAIILSYSVGHWLIVMGMCIQFMGENERYTLLH